jgi:hypothetical protein
MNAHSEADRPHTIHRAAKVCVAEVLSSRYGAVSNGAQRAEGAGDRPQSWDDRKTGIDVIRSLGGETIKLKSSPMQSTPKPGWVLVLTGGTYEEGYTWTLYGISRNH